jgi:hypothetical protein
MAPIQRLVVDVLKPHDPSLVTFTEELADTACVDALTTSLIELDQEVQNVKLTVEGDDIDVDAVTDGIEDLGGTVHSVDEVSCGTHVVEARRTPQD